MISIAIVEEEHIANAVSVTRQNMADEGFGVIRQSMISTAVSELATNAYVHAGHGTVTIALLGGDKGKGIEITVEDHGPGIANLEMAMKEGYSTAGSLGVGLPGTKRLSDEFSIRSTVDEGTVAVIRAWLDR